MTINEIIKKYKDGELSREIDEKGTGGFWDFALMITETAEQTMASNDYWELVEVIYNALLEAYENKN